MPVTGLSHITFTVRDVDRTACLWRDGLGASEVYDSLAKNHSVSREKFLLLGGIWIALMEGSPKGRSYQHVAFQVEESELDDYEARLRKLGVEIMPQRTRIPGEGASLYFYDYDDNLFELHAGKLHERLKAYAAWR
ncbi:MAG: FosX/FosE/FosI family fosfomycin resistance hydrolase [Thermodesulfobacteriota bacterium]